MEELADPLTPALHLRGGGCRFIFRIIRISSFFLLDFNNNRTNYYSDGRMKQEPNQESKVWVRGPSAPPLSSTGRQAEARATTPSSG